MIASESSVFRRLASNTLIPRWNALHSTNGVFSCMISLLMDTPPLIDKKSAETDQSLKIGQSLLCDRTARLSGYVLIKRTPILLNRCPFLLCRGAVFELGQMAQRWLSVCRSTMWVYRPFRAYSSAGLPCSATMPPDSTTT